MAVTISATHTVTVDSVTMLSDGVVELQLVGEDLPAWTAGAHIDIELPSGTVRQYSLCGDPADRERYTIAVLKEPNGRGGSREVHEAVHAGQQLKIRGPRNHFELGDHDGYLFIAGGIGITPILAMVRTVAAARKPWKLVYGGRTLSSMAYLDALDRVPGGEVKVVPQDTHGYPDLDGALSQAGTWHVYTCGPEPLLQAVDQATRRILGSGVLHFERFGADPDAVLEDDSDAPFRVELAQSGVTLDVGSRERLIDVVRRVVPTVPFSCEEGYCGSCETAVLAGVPLHRDSVLTPDEREANDTMMICVGRSKTPVLQLDI